MTRYVDTRDEAREGGEELEGREGEDRTAVGRGPRRLVEDPDGGVAGPCGCRRAAGVALDAQALEGEGRAGTVFQEPFSAGAVGAVDADGGVQAEAAGGLPGEHVGNGVIVEEAAALKEAEHAALQRALEAADVVAGEARRLTEGEAARVALGEEAVEDDHVEVEVGVGDRTPAAC